MEAIPCWLGSIVTSQQRMLCNQRRSPVSTAITVHYYIHWAWMLVSWVPVAVMIVSGEWRRDGMVALGILLVQLVVVSREY